MLRGCWWYLLRCVLRGCVERVLIGCVDRVVCEVVIIGYINRLY